MNTFLILLSVLSGSGKALLSKKMRAFNRTRFGLSLSNAAVSSAALLGIAAYTALSAGTGGFVCSIFTLITGLLFAVFTTGAQMFCMDALKTGPVSVVAFLYSGGFLLPTAAGVLYWHEKMTLLKFVGILLLLAAMLLISAKDDRKAASSGWQGKAFAAMAMSGAVGVMQKLHQSSPHRAESGAFLTIAFAGAASLSLLLALTDRQSRKEALSVRFPTVPALCCGAVVALANVLNLRLSGVLPAALMFPVVNGGTILLTAVSGRLLYREAMPPRRIAGLALGLAAILIVSR